VFQVETTGIEICNIFTINRTIASVYAYSIRERFQTSLRAIMVNWRERETPEFRMTDHYDDV